MSGLDFSAGIGLIVATAAFFYLGYFPLAIFTGMLFFLVMASMLVFHLRQPQPRLIIGAVAVHTQDEMQEVLNKLDKEDEE